MRGIGKEDFKMKLLLVTISFVLMPYLSGCTLLVAGGAGAEGGYIAGQEEQTAGEVIDDQWVTTKIKTKFAIDSDVSAMRINVDTKDMVVTLTGTVKSKKEMEKALKIARETKGVKKVINKLKIEKE